MLETYCVECHNSLDLAGDLSFEGLTAQFVPAHAEVFEVVVTKLRGRLMPPPGSPQPAQEDIDALIAWLERSLDEDTEPHAVGHVPAQRLSRTEYAHAVKDLLGVDIDPAEHLRLVADQLGVDRLVIGSDIGQTRGPYSRIVDGLREATRLLDDAERAAVLHDNAARIYSR